MNLLEQKINHFGKLNGEKIALQGDNLELSYTQLIDILASKALQIKESKIALLMENSPAWAIMDLVTFFSQKSVTPLPLFFSDNQIEHCLVDAGIELLIADNEVRVANLNVSFTKKQTIKVAETDLYFYHLTNIEDNQKISEPYTAIAKITYTSGTTGQPKGVMLSEKSIIKKVQSLASATQARSTDNCISLLPLSTLLENIAGLYIPLFCGGKSILLSSKKTGLLGSSKIDVHTFINLFNSYKPTAFIVIPQLLKLLVKICSEGFNLPSSVRFIAVGGAAVSNMLLQQAQQLKLPVYQGYGFSEATSVVSLNPIDSNKISSVGKVLENHQITLSEQGEILVKNDLYNGYLGKQSFNSEEYYHSGDIGYLDEQGYLYITGRMRNIIISSYGRNISPEWIEKELEIIPFIDQVVVCGQGQAYLLMIYFSQTDQIEGLHLALEKLNQTLPDYARINHFIRINEPFSVDNGQLLTSGIINREKIYQNYQQQINHYYDNDNDNDNN